MIRRLADVSIRCSPGCIGSAAAWPRRERLARRPGMWLVLGIFGGLALILGLSIWRIRDVSDLPDIGDPFDVADSSSGP